MFCPNCGSQNPDNANNCTNCGTSLNNAAQYQQFYTNNQLNNEYGQQGPMNNNGGEQKSKLVAGLLGILVGSLGVHDFYLGNTRNGVIKLLLTLVGWILCGLGPLVAGIWGLVEGIQILIGKISTDAKGVPLKE